MRQKNLNIIICFLLGINFLGCMKNEPQETRYEKAKKQAEEKVAELVDMIMPIKALERGDLSGISANNNTTISIEKIKTLNYEVNEAMRKVSELKPEGYDDDYNQWTGKIKQKLESIR